jgi:hypothetical protein
MIVSIVTFKLPEPWTVAGGLWAGVRCFFL